MHPDARKLNLTEEVLQVTSRDTLNELETVLKKSKLKGVLKECKTGINGFVGILTK